MSAPTSTLTDALSEHMRKQHVLAGVFTTFSFDPKFFEEEVVPVLFNRSDLGHADVRLALIEDSLRATRLAVYYDREALQHNGSAKLDIRRVPVTRTTGSFHPKLVLLLLKDDDGRRSLLVAALSANLTRSGWWQNVEAGHVEVIEAGATCSFRADLLMALRLIRASATSVAEQPELEELRKFIYDEVLEDNRKLRRMAPRLFVGQEPLARFLRDTLPVSTEGYNLEVLSPYFDKAGAPALQALVEALAPRQVRVFLPRREDGTAQCWKGFFEAASALEDITWSTLPSSLLSRRDESGEQVSRFVHAKVYRLWSATEERQFTLVGSANLTQAAHSHSGSGNLEASFLIEEPVKERPRWWLVPIESRLPRRFLDDLSEEESGEDESLQEVVLPLALEFSWVTGVARVFWEAAEPSPGLELRLNNVPLHRLTGLPSQVWVELPADVASALRNHLLSSSFIHAHRDDGHTCILLIQEEGMECKPSLLSTLSVEDILRYWSFFTDEQRALFLAEKLRSLKGQRQKQEPPPGTSSSLFDRFAGIFHAFQQFETTTASALERGDERNAVYRLFGQRHDSLGNLVARLRDDEAFDALHRYVTYLTVRQLLLALEGKFPAFFTTHRARRDELWAQLAPLEALRHTLRVGGTPEEDQSFLDWFERAFLYRARDEEAA